MRRDPKARVAIQTEADPKDKALEAQEVRELRGIKVALQSVNATLKLLVALLTPKKATRLNPTVTEIPKETP